MIFYISKELSLLQECLEAEFKEFESHFKFETRLKHSWFHFKIYLVFRDLSRRLIVTVFLAVQRRGLNSLNLASDLMFCSIFL